MLKKATPIIILILIAIVVGISGCTDSSADSSSDTSPTKIKANATTVTATQLYNDKGALVGKPVKMKGEMMQTGDDQIMVNGIKMSYGYNMDDHNILVDGNFANVTVYENDEVWVYGIFEGQVSYTTVLGADRKVPGIKNAWVEPTGKKYS